MSRLLRLSLSSRVWLAAQEATRNVSEDPVVCRTPWDGSPTCTAVRVVRAEVLADGTMDLDIVFPEAAVQAVFSRTPWQDSTTATSAEEPSASTDSISSDPLPISCVESFEDMDLRCYEQLSPSPESIETIEVFPPCSTCGGHEVNGFCSLCYLRGLTDLLPQADDAGEAEVPDESAKDLCFMDLLTWAMEDKTECSRHDE
ncbi:E1A protein [Murine adenovirus 1]|uniref:Early E1A 21 kDa protein n=1 Tax=Murine adenovirus A serotype 1 TaxID=10530 RepID=E1A_ADEM1|nr:E1A protein [Murine mastadenovirus A]P12534.1 RecName: Full=Early E1A 21 kDa protein [Murine adenovirus 1]AAA42424.1 E1A protein [Murine adenovirus 1]